MKKSKRIFTLLMVLLMAAIIISQNITVLADNAGEKGIRGVVICNQSLMSNASGSSEVIGSVIAKTEIMVNIISTDKMGNIWYYISRTVNNANDSKNTINNNKSGWIINNAVNLKIDAQIELNAPKTTTVLVGEQGKATYCEEITILEMKIENVDGADKLWCNIDSCLDENGNVLEGWYDEDGNSWDEFHLGINVIKCSKIITAILKVIISLFK